MERTTITRFVAHIFTGLVVQGMVCGLIFLHSWVWIRYVAPLFTKFAPLLYSKWIVYASRHVIPNHGTLIPMMTFCVA